MSALRKHRHERNFTILDNPLLDDERLSFRARGVLAFLLSKPDDYPVNATALARRAKEGRDAIEAAIRELIGLGYLRRRREQDTRGHWKTYTDVYEAPEMDGEDPATENGFSGVGGNSTEDGFPGVGQTPSSESMSAGRADNWKPEAGQPVAKDQGLVGKDNNKGQPPSAAAADPEPEVLDAEIINDGEPGTGPQPETTQTVYAAYIDWRRAQGIADPDKRMRGQITKQLGEAFAAGHAAEVIKRGLWVWHHSPYGPSSLAGYIDTEARGGGRNGRVSEHELRLQASIQELLDLENVS